MSVRPAVRQPVTRLSLTGKQAITRPTDSPTAVLAGSNWQPSRFDEAHINNGTVVVDAVGQHAGTLRVGGGTNPTLVVSSGWLKVENDIIIGGFGVSGELNLTGGTLRAKTINRPSGAFNFSGGKAKRGYDQLLAHEQRRNPRARRSYWSYRVQRCADKYWSDACRRRSHPRGRYIANRAFVAGELR